MHPIFLEGWIHDIAGRVLGIECITRADLERYQFLRLSQTLRYVYEKSSFYRELFDRAGANPSDVRSFADFSKVPFTDPQSLSEAPYRFLCISQADVARPHSFVTSGTTGPQKKVFWSRGDLERIVEFMAAGIATVAGPEDVVQIMLADGRPYSQADLLFQGVKKLGATPVLAGMDLAPLEHLGIIKKSVSTVLFGYAGKLFRMSKALHGRIDLSGLGVRALFLAGEYVPDGMRRQMQQMWGCPVHTHYGLTEMGLGVAVECEARTGYHFNEAGLLVEVVDPRTGQPVPAGEEGELVFTTLTREAMPLVRYRTHDVSRLIPDPCLCGAHTLLRLDSVRKRLESVVSLGSGGELYPALLDDALFDVPEVIDYRAVLTRVSGKERLELNAEATSREPGVRQAIHRKLLSIPALASGLGAGGMLDPTVALVAPGALAGSVKKRLVSKYPPAEPGALLL